MSHYRDPWKVIAKRHRTIDYDDTNIEGHRSITLRSATDLEINPRTSDEQIVASRIYVAGVIARAVLASGPDIIDARQQCHRFPRCRDCVDIVTEGDLTHVLTDGGAQVEVVLPMKSVDAIRHQLLDTITAIYEADRWDPDADAIPAVEPLELDLGTFANPRQEVNR